MEVNEQLAIDHGLKKDEYAKICELLKRTPNITELGIFFCNVERTLFI